MHMGTTKGGTGLGAVETESPRSGRQSTCPTPTALYGNCINDAKSLESCPHGSTRRNPSGPRYTSPALYTVSLNVLSKSTCGFGGSTPCPGHSLAVKFVVSMGNLVLVHAWGNTEAWWSTFWAGNPEQLEYASCCAVVVKQGTPSSSVAVQ